MDSLAERTVSNTVGCSRMTMGTSTAASEGCLAVMRFSCMASGSHCGGWAKRVRKALGSDIGIGITGWAGPDGDDVGLVFVALASRSGCFVRRLQCGHAPRPRIRLIAASNALDMIRRYLTGLDV